jgi:hypothetical protein
MQHRIDCCGDPFDPYLSGCWMKEGQEFRRAIPLVFMRIAGWARFWCPTARRIRLGLEGTSFILTPDGEPQCFANQVGSFD